MSKQHVTYSELIHQKSPQQQQGRPKKPKNEDVFREQQVTYTELRNSKLSQQQQQQQQHRRARKVPARGHEEEVTYTELKNSQPSQLQQHRNSQGIKRTGAAISPSIPWKLVTGILGILCLGLLAAMESMTVRIVKTCGFQEDNNTTTSNHNVEGCHSGPCRENWVAYRNCRYLFSKESASWEGSRTAWAAQNSSLLQIDSREERDFLKLLSLYHWIGLSLSENEKSWQWTDGSPLSSDLLEVHLSNTRWTCVLSHPGNEVYAKNCSLDERYICKSSSC